MTETIVKVAMPKEIASAIVGVMSKVRLLGKDAKNAHGGYKYVSVDQFLEQIGPLMAEAGVAVFQNEVKADVVAREANGKSQPWLACEYDFTLVHSAGGIYGPLRRAVSVHATGPQAYGAAQAYALKYFLRSLFLVPTGEEDADAHVKDELPVAPKKAIIEADSPTIRKMCETAISMIADDEQAIKWWKDNKTSMENMLEADRVSVEETFKRKRHEFNQKETV